jgi:RHH-type proline utilization regulon transcriptional repressor/proline dehydrogenase/delta 1-pyrroline-5-carboxylate dehydrogenase
VTQQPPPNVTTDPAAIEAGTQLLGRALLDAAADYRPGPAERIEDWLLTHAVADDRFRSRLLRYMDVLAALDHDTGGQEAQRLAHEYFGDSFPELPFALRWLLRLARDERVPAALVGASARRSAELFARRFITPPGIETVRRTTEYLADHGRLPSFDLLGEAVLSDDEARSYVNRYLALIVQLADDPAANARTPSGDLALQISLKLSSLTAHFTPIDPAGTLARVRPPLEAIVEAALRAGIGITIDMEQHAFRDLTEAIFGTVFARGERFGAWPDAGIVLQAYLRDAPAHAEALAAFARARGTAFQVRLVKGAYWDYEGIVADANRWPSPVWIEKAATDRSFERSLAVLIAAHPHIRLAVASHNARTHAVAEALAEAGGLPSGAIEHQTLFRTAEGTSRALAALGWQARDYVPVGELLPGMAYLVRRVLENSSQAGFLLQSRRGVPADELLRPPPDRPLPPATLVTPRDDFGRLAEARWFDPAFRDAFEAALVSTRAQWGQHIELLLGSEVLAPDATTEVFSPSHPAGPPIATVALAGAEQAQRAAIFVRGGMHAWARTPAAQRAAVLRHAAGLLEARAHEFAARVLHEGGRDRDGAYAEVVEAADYLRYYASQAELLFLRFPDSIAPRGVVAVIPPWNFSLAIPTGMTAAALACGNGVVLKPAGQTPAVAAHFVALLHEAGVPAEALVCLPGRGSTAGQALVDSPAVGMVAFTGSRAVGTRMHEDVARVQPLDGTTKALVAEMGGKNAILVFSDADLDEAVDGILHSTFGHANQKCSAASRVLVAAPIFERLRDRLVAAARSLHVGPSDEAATQVNPLIDRAAWERLQQAAATAREECDVLLDDFARDPATLEAGPLIVALTAHRALASRTFTEELFGPILVLTPFSDEDEAIRLANGTVYGLTAGVFSRSPRTIERVTQAIQAGTVYVNRGTTGARVGVEPFGGMKFSGTGPKAGGPDYLWAFVRRIDARADTSEDAIDLTAGTSPPELDTLAPSWDAPLAQRLEAVERAAVLLGNNGHPDAALLFAATQAARREFGRPVPTVQAAGQHTTLTYDVPRGRCLLHATGPQAAWWLGAALLAGNAVGILDAATLATALAALRLGGVPVEASLALPGGVPALLAAADTATVDFVATDGGPSLARALTALLGPTLDGARGLRPLLSPFDGPQPVEPGFLHRFAWPRVIAIRTLRHGADLALEPSRE